MENRANRETAFRETGAVEQDRPEQPTNVAPLKAQADHRYQDPLNKQNDSGLPERGQNEEFTGESQGRNDLNQDTNANPGPIRRELQRDDSPSNRMDMNQDTDQNAQNFDVRSRNDEGSSNERPKSSQRDPDGNAEGVLNDQDPGERQKENQNQKKDDELAA